MADLQEQNSQSNLLQRIQILEDKLALHAHHGYDLSSKLINGEFSNARIVNEATLGDGKEKSGSLEFLIAPGKGDVQAYAGIAAGDFANTGAASGFIFGIDDSDSDKVKFYWGDSTSFIKWDGVTLAIQGISQVSKSYTLKGSVSAQDAVYLSNNTHVIDLELSSSQNLSAADSTSLSITGDITIELWVKLETQLSATQIMMFVDKEDSYKFFYQESGGTNYFGFAINAGTPLTIAQTLTVATWTHIAATWTNDTITMYVNGVSIGTGTSGQTSITDNANVLRIGAQNNSPAIRFFDGMIDDVRLWSVVRTGTEINNNKSIQLLGTETNLNAYWRLNNNLVDKTANGNTLTNNGSAVFSTDTPFVNSGISTADASTSETSDSFIGFASAAGVDGATVSIVIAGEVTGLSGLTAGALYYLSDTAGGISATAGTVTRKVGIATSATTLL